MTENDKLQIFENQPIRTAWDETKEEWYFSVVDVVKALTEQSSPSFWDSIWGLTHWLRLPPCISAAGCGALPG